MVRQAEAFLHMLTSKLPLVQEVLENVRLFEKHPFFRKEAAYVIAGDLLLSHTRSNRLKNPCRQIVSILEMEEDLFSEYKKCSENMNPADEIYTPRWVCINLMLVDVTSVIEHLSEEGFSQKFPASETYDDFLSSVRGLSIMEYMVDFHFDNLLVFPPASQIRQSHLITAGKLLLQDKVSCLPPAVSGVKVGDTAVDACAAPGNKSTVLASYIGRDGKLICVERDSERFAVLKKRVKHHGARNVTFINDDFTCVDLDKFAGVTTVILDPSCSNSGVKMVRDTDSVSGERYRRLADMQFHLLSFALRIPGVQNVVYSTCSVNVIENENVVARALDEFQDKFELDDLSLKLNEWKNFGEEDYPFSKKVLRTDPKQDLCHGFFVTKFVARSSCEANSCLAGSVEEVVDSQKKKKLNKNKNFNTTDDLIDSHDESFDQKNGTVRSNETHLIANGINEYDQEKINGAEEIVENTDTPLKKKKKRKRDAEKDMLNSSDSPLKKKKKLELNNITLSDDDECNEMRDVLKEKNEVIRQEEISVGLMTDEVTKTKKKKKKKHSENDTDFEDSQDDSIVQNSPVKQKKKKLSTSDVLELDQESVGMQYSPIKKKKSKKSKDDMDLELVQEDSSQDNSPVKRKKSKKSKDFIDLELVQEDSSQENSPVKKKKKKRRSEDNASLEISENLQNSSIKSKKSEDDLSIDLSVVDIALQTSHNKKKKKKKSENSSISEIAEEELLLQTSPNKKKKKKKPTAEDDTDLELTLSDASLQDGISKKKKKKNRSAQLLNGDLCLSENASLGVSQNTLRYSSSVRGILSQASDRSDSQSGSEEGVKKRVTFASNLEQVSLFHKEEPCFQEVKTKKKKKKSKTLNLVETLECNETSEISDGSKENGDSESHQTIKKSKKKKRKSGDELEISFESEQPKKKKKKSSKESEE